MNKADTMIMEESYKSGFAAGQAAEREECAKRVAGLGGQKVMNRIMYPAQTLGPWLKRETVIAAIRARANAEKGE